MIGARLGCEKSGATVETECLVIPWRYRQVIWNGLTEPIARQLSAACRLESRDKGGLRSPVIHDRDHHDRHIGFGFTPILRTVSARDPPSCFFLHRVSSVRRTPRRARSCAPRCCSAPHRCRSPGRPISPARSPPDPSRRRAPVRARRSRRPGGSRARGAFARLRVASSAR